MKRPAFQFYPGDWRKDVELRSCSVAARGLWIDLMCLAHECEPYGHLTVNGKPMNAAQIAGQVGLTKQQCAALLLELTDNGVARTTAEGVVYSKRMVADEVARDTRAEVGRANGSKGAEFGARGADHGKKGGRPKAETPLDNPGSEPGQKPPQNPRPSSSSSASAEEISEPTVPPSPALPSRLSRFPPGFEAFWQAYPRKIGKDAAIRAFAKRRFTEEQRRHVLAAVAVQRGWEQWTRDGGQFIPHPATWLNEGRWQDEAPAVSTGGDRFAGSAI